MQTEELSIPEPSVEPLALLGDGGRSHNDVVQPVNAEVMRWPLWAILQDWTRRRGRWEYGRAVRAGLVIAALGALVASIQPSVEINR